MDRHVPDERLSRHGFEVVDEETDDLSSWDLAVVLTDHDAVDYARLADQVGLVFDTRGIYRRRGIDRPEVVVL
jgi:UDP-N-acetyl-D-glucosamine dehydrogenase